MRRPRVRSPPRAPWWLVLTTDERNARSQSHGKSYTQYARDWQARSAKTERLRTSRSSKSLKPLQLLHHRVSVFHLTTILTTVFVAHFCSHNWPAAPAKNRISLANTAFQDQCKCAIFEKKRLKRPWKRWRQLCKFVQGLNGSIWVFGRFTKTCIFHQMLIFRHLLKTSIPAYPSGSENPGFKPIKALTRFV